MNRFLIKIMSRKGFVPVVLILVGGLILMMGISVVYLLTKPKSTVVINNKPLPVRKAIPTAVPKVEEPATNTNSNNNSAEQIGENDHYKILVTDRQAPDAMHTSAIVEIFDKSTLKLSTISGRLKIFGSTHVVWDPLNRYALLSNGTYVTRTVVPISLNENKQSFNDFCTTLEPIFWSNFIVYENCDEYPSSRPWGGGGEAPSIVATNLANGSVTPIVKSSLTTQLTLKKITGDVLYYDKETLKTSGNNPNDWLDKNLTVTTSETYNLLNLNSQ